MPVDAHAHLDKYQDHEIDGVLAEIEERRILTLSVSVDEVSFLAAERIAARSPYAVATYGVHPWEAPDHIDHLDRMADIAARSPMIGEIGLDHRFVDDESRYPVQRLVLATLLEIAAEQGKAVNLHCPGAEREMAEMLIDHGTERAIVHWYSGPLDDLAPLLAAGCMFTVGVEVLHSDHIRAIAAAIPDDRLLVETDNPGGHRWLTGETGMPHLIHDVLAELAAVRGTTPEEMGDLTSANFAGFIAGDPHLAPWRPLVG